MNSKKALYNSRIMKIFLEYMAQYHPDVDVDKALEYANMTRYEVNDPAHWFDQEQADRFNEILVRLTGNENIARDAGRYAVSSEALGAAKQYTLGMIGPVQTYLLMEKLYPIMSKGATIKTRKVAKNKVEIIARPGPGVKEKPYQCENRIGTFESLAKLFTGEYAHIEHPECFHKGASQCRYIVSWKKLPHIAWRQTRNYLILFSLLVQPAIVLLLPLAYWVGMDITAVFGIISLSLISERIEKSELTRTLKTQGEVARELIEEINTRYNNALLVQEIGEAAASHLDIKKVITTVMCIIEKRMDFDRGMVMLANPEKTRLVYMAGFGYTSQQMDLLEDTEFHLDNPQSRGVFVQSYREQKPVLISDISEIESDLSKRSQEFAKKMNARSFICIPIVYEKESLGLLIVDNVRSMRPLTQTDINLLTGIASQMAISIINAISYQILQESEKKYRDLVENAHSIILQMDKTGKVTFFNEFAQKFFGYRSDEIIGKNVIGTIVPDTTENKLGLNKLIEDLGLNPDRHTVSENKAMLKNGDTVFIAWTFKPMFDKDSVNEVLCIGSDITKLRLAEQEKKNLEAQLQRAQKMEALGRLAGGVAHDLNNILTGIVSYPDLLLMQVPEDSSLRKPILAIQKSGEKAAAVVQDLLTMARRGVTVSEVVNLNSVVRDYLKSPEYKRLMQDYPDIVVETDLDPDLLNILGSPVHLSKTLMNLVSNAAEAMGPANGEITISTKSVYLEKPVEGYETIKEGEYSVLSVSDTGDGISQDDLPKIFEPFYTKKVMGMSGSGLGLAVVWGTVKDHNAFIDIHTDIGKGTRFELYFPITRKQATTKLEAGNMEDYMGDGKILVVDDIGQQRDIASALLGRLGYTVIAVDSGEKAVEFLKENYVDLVILDMIMEPGIDGLETYKRIIKTRPGQKAIIVSGYAETERVKEAQTLGVGFYLKKPYTLNKLGRAVKNALDA